MCALRNTKPRALPWRCRQTISPAASTTALSGGHYYRQEAVSGAVLELYRDLEADAGSWRLARRLD